MRREYNVAERGETLEWEVYLDLPLNGNITDYSGNGRVCTRTNNIFIEDPYDSSRMVMLCNSMNSGLITPSGFRTIYNKSKIEIEFLIKSTSNSYPNIMDSSGSRVANGIFSQLESGKWYITHSRAKGNSVTNCLSFSSSLLSTNCWYKLTMIYYNGVSEISIVRCNDGNVMANGTYSIGDNITSYYDTLRIGRSDYSRYFNGLFRNLKVYQHL